MSLLRLNLMLTILSLFIFVRPAFAVHPEESSEIENLKRRIAILEGQQVQEPEHAIDFGKISEYLTLHGLLEVEATYTNPEDGDEESDLTLATAELSLEALLNDYIGGHLTLLYEEEEGEDDDIDVDEAVISLSAPTQLFGQSPSLHAGRMYVPFGMFNSYMISDPLTLDLGETQNTAVIFALDGDLWSLQTGAFNGDVDKDDNNKIDSWVISFIVSMSENYQFGFSYLNDLAESDIELVQNDAPYNNNVGGASAFVSMHYKNFGFEAEYLSAVEKFDGETVLASESDLTGRKPAAWNLELAWVPLERLQIAVRYEQAEDFQENVKRYGGTVSYSLHENVIVACEYLYAKADVDENDPVHLVTAQLALEF